MSERIIPDLSDDKKTKNKILDEATKLYATQGIDVVSLRDIADAAGIRASTIYNYYDGKDSLIEGILSRFETEYKNYFVWLSGANAKASSLDEVLDNMFIELSAVREISTYFGISILLKEQFDNESARKRVYKLFFDDSIHSMQADLDRLIENGVIPPTNTNIIATIIMFCVLIGNNLRIHEYMGYNPPIDCTKMYADMKRFLQTVLSKGC